MVGSYLSEQKKKMKQIPGKTASVLSIESFLVNIFVLFPFFFLQERLFTFLLDYSSLLMLVICIKKTTSDLSNFMIVSFHSFIFFLFPESVFFFLAGKVIVLHNVIFSCRYVSCTRQGYEWDIEQARASRIC